MSSDDPKLLKAQANFKALSSVAGSLNLASDELSRVVTVLDESLKKLNIGLTVWIQFRSRSTENEPDTYDDDQIGYAKVNGKWGITLRRVWGNGAFGIANQEGPWLFHEAPREMRLYCVDKIPDLIGALNEEAFQTAKKVQEKTQEVRELARVIDQTAAIEPHATPRLHPPDIRRRRILIRRSDPPVTAPGQNKGGGQ